MTQSGPTTRAVSVMYSFDRPDEHSNPYVKLLVNAVQDEIRVRYFSWKELVLRPPDVLHIHWPETMVRGSTRSRTHVKALLGISYLFIHRLLGTKLVWTVHNTAPHEGEGRASSLFCGLVDRWSAHRILIQDVDVLDDPHRASVVLHGTFVDWYGPISPTRQPVKPPVKLAFAGLIRPYKGVPELLRAFAGARERTTMELTVRGAISSDGLRHELETLAHGVPDLELTFGHLADTVLAETIAAADLVVLPYRRLHNSGAALLALSLGRAVMLPSVPMARDLQRELGTEWVYLYEGELTAESLSTLVRAFVADSRCGTPDMSARQWADAGQAHIAVYRSLA